MKDNPIREHLEDGLSNLTLTERQHQEMLNHIVQGGKSPMKKKLTVSFVLALALMLATVTGALAASGAFERMMEVWQNSFEKMNTTGTVDVLDREEASQTAQELSWKNDLILSTVPQEGDLDYDVAFAIARQAILDTFGTPEAELDAMGVYPTFYNTPFQDEPDDSYTNEWEFYITPRHDVNIDEDHEYEAPGEYLVRVASPSGEINDIFWYIDAFWPDYALRTWNAGKHEYVYQKALNGNAFYQMPKDKQDEFLKLFEEAGFDAKALEKDMTALLNEFRWWQVTEGADNLLDQDTPAVRATVGAIERTYGFTREMMKTYCFRLLPSPFDSDTEDYCLIFDHNLIYREEQTPENRTGGVGWYELELHQYPHRLGYFLVRLNPETREAVETLHVPWTNTYGTANYNLLDDQIAESDLLLGRKQWTLEDLKEFEQLRQKAIALDKAVAEGTIRKSQADKQFLAMVRENGGLDVKTEGKTRLTEKDARARADQTLSFNYDGFSKEKFSEVKCEFFGESTDDPYFGSNYYQVDYIKNGKALYQCVVNGYTGKVLYWSGPEDLAE